MSTSQPIDVRGMAIVHRLFRQSYDEAAQLVRAAPTPSPGRVTFLADHIDLILRGWMFVGAVARNIGMKYNPATAVFDTDTTGVGPFSYATLVATAVNNARKSIAFARSRNSGGSSIPS